MCAENCFKYFGIRPQVDGRTVRSPVLKETVDIFKQRVDCGTCFIIGKQRHVISS